MELSIIITVVIIIIVFFIFRKPIKRTSESADKLNDSATTLAIEGKKENTRRILAAMKELEDMGGPVDFDEVYAKACGKKK